MTDTDDLLARADYWLANAPCETAGAGVDHDLIRDLRAEVERLQAAVDAFVAFVDSYPPDSVLRREYAMLYELLMRYVADFRAVSPHHNGAT